MKSFLQSFAVIALLLACAFANAQSITSVSPNSANQGQSLYVTITGQNTHFNQGSGTNNVTLFKQGSPSTQITAAFSSASGTTNLSAYFVIPSSVPIGYYDVQVYNSVDGNITMYSAFNIMIAPSIANINVTSGKQGKTLSVTITGQNTNFTQGSSTAVWLFKAASNTIYATNINVLNLTTLNATFSIPANAATGLWDLNIYSSGNYYTKTAAFDVLNASGIDNLLVNNKSTMLFPNPFNGNSILNYRLEQTELVEINVYNILGEKLKMLVNSVQSAGEHTIKITENDMLDKGIYFISVKIGNNKTEVIKAIRQ